MYACMYACVYVCMCVCYCYTQTLPCIYNSGNCWGARHQILQTPIMHQPIVVQASQVHFLCAPPRTIYATHPILYHREVRHTIMHGIHRCVLTSLHTYMVTYLQCKHTHMPTCRLVPNKVSRSPYNNRSLKSHLLQRSPGNTSIN